jgi:hypothetical protein
MTETKIVIDNLSFNYEGLFKVNEFYRFLDSYFAEKNYDKHEVINMEKVDPNGKYIELEIEPYKKLTDYAKMVVRVNCKMHGIKEVEVEREGHKVRMNQGRINILIDGFIMTDYENRWNDRPMYVFIRTMYDKFIFKNYIDQFESKLTDEINQLYIQMKAFFNLYRY